MYRKPTEKEKAFAMKWGWDAETVERGYDIVDYDGTGLLEIQRIDDVFAQSNVTDDDCAAEAERSGFCRIIPVEELPLDFDRRYFGWVDTPENRRLIAQCAMRKDGYYDN